MSLEYRQTVAFVRSCNLTSKTELEDGIMLRNSNGTCRASTNLRWPRCDRSTSVRIAARSIRDGEQRNRMRNL